MKMSKKKNKENKMSPKTKRILISTLLLVLLFVVIIVFELIFSYVISREANSIVVKDEATIVKTLTNHNYKITNVNENNNYINKTCKNSGCYLKVVKYDDNYLYFNIQLNKNGHYYLYVFSDNEIILGKKDLGITLEDAYFTEYMNNVAFITVINDETYTFDYALIINSSLNKDEFESVGIDELEYTDTGIVYYYEQCTSDTDYNAIVNKVVRIPFSQTSTILSSEKTNYKWCTKK